MRALDQVVSWRTAAPVNARVPFAVVELVAECRVCNAVLAAMARRPDNEKQIDYWRGRREFALLALSVLAGESLPELVAYAKAAT